MEMETDILRTAEELMILVSVVIRKNRIRSFNTILNILGKEHFHRPGLRFYRYHLVNRVVK
jgi:hypothetical protein